MTQALYTFGQTPSLHVRERGLGMRLTVGVYQAYPPMKYHHKNSEALTTVHLYRSNMIYTIEYISKDITYNYCLANKDKIASILGRSLQ